MARNDIQLFVIYHHRIKSYRMVNLFFQLIRSFLPIYNLVLNMQHVFVKA